MPFCREWVLNQGTHARGVGGEERSGPTTHECEPASWICGELIYTTCARYCLIQYHACPGCGCLQHLKCSSHRAHQGEQATPRFKRNITPEPSVTMVLDVQSVPVSQLTTAAGPPELPCLAAGQEAALMPGRGAAQPAGRCSGPADWPAPHSCICRVSCPGPP